MNNVLCVTGGKGSLRLPACLSSFGTKTFSAADDLRVESREKSGGMDIVKIQSIKNINAPNVTKIRIPITTVHLFL